MNARTPIATVVAWLIAIVAPMSALGAASAPAGAAAVGSGNIVGRVDHPATGQYLNNARQP